jgi:hypothetical protein
MEPTQRSHLMAHVVLPLTIPFLRVASLGQLALVSRSTAALVYPSLFYNLIPITAKDFDGEERDTPGYRLGRTLLAEGGWERAKHVLYVTPYHNVSRNTFNKTLPNALRSYTGTSAD